MQLFRRFFPALLLAFLLFTVHHQTVNAASTVSRQQFFKAKVVSIVQEGVKDIGDTKNAYQVLKILILDGHDANKQITITYGGDYTLQNSQKVHGGDTVIVTQVTDQNKKTAYVITDTYRLPLVLIIISLFFIFVLLMTGKKGLGSIIGLIISLAVIVLFIVPQILAGQDPLLISIVGSVGIILVTTYLAHGVSEQTSVALGATLLSLILTALLAVGCVALVHLTGLGSEDAYTLQFGMKNFNFQGLLLGGIIIGALGVLNDVTVTQAATVYELAATDTKLTSRLLITKGLRIGREHILSLVNTLVLAYAGASIGLFIFIVLAMQTHSQPLWVILNSEVLTEEIIRVIAGSIGLMCAVPITTVLAAFIAKYKISIK